jgi:putative tryptophan/tyrosine transport system substrate-binding protein
MRLIGLAVIFILSLTLAPLAAEGQEAGKIPRISVLSAGTAGMRTMPSQQGFDKRMRALGWIDGQNVTVEYSFAEGKLERLPALAADLVRRVDLVVAVGSEFTLRAATQASRAIPIVMIAINYDPVALGYVASLAQPGGNVTGVFLQQVELTPKRLQLLKEALPRAGRVAVLWDALSADQLKAAKQAASSLRVELRAIEQRGAPSDIDGAFREAVRGRADAALVLASTFSYRDRERIAQLALKHRLPTVCAHPEDADAGNLIAYGANLSAMFGRAAEYVDKILHGAKPADLPVEQPTKFELVINIKTAKALGLTIPQSVLLQANQVIE